MAASGSAAPPATGPARHSLTRHLLLWSLGALALVWGSFVFMGYRTGVHEADELTDGHLASVAVLFAHLSGSEAVGKSAAPPYTRRSTGPLSFTSTSASLFVRGHPPRCHQPLRLLPPVQARLAGASSGGCCSRFRSLPGSAPWAASSSSSRRRLPWSGPIARGATRISTCGRPRSPSVGPVRRSRCRSIIGSTMP